MNEERRLIYHWRLFIHYISITGFRSYKSSEFDQCMIKDYVISGETV